MREGIGINRKIITTAVRPEEHELIRKQAEKEVRSVASYMRKQALQGCEDQQK